MLLPLKLTTSICNYVLVLYFASNKGMETKVLLREEDLERTIQVAKSSQDDELLSYYYMKIPKVSCVSPVFYLPSGPVQVPGERRP